MAIAAVAVPVFCFFQGLLGPWRPWLRSLVCVWGIYSKSVWAEHSKHIFGVALSLARGLRSPHPAAVVVRIAVNTVVLLSFSLYSSASSLSATLPVATGDLRDPVRE